MGIAERRPWSPEEDAILVELLQTYGIGDWVKVAKMLNQSIAPLPPRAAKSVRLRWVNQLDPNLNKAPLTPEEWVVVEELVAKIGTRWCDIVKDPRLKNRSDNMVKNVWYGRHGRPRPKRRGGANGSSKLPSGSDGGWSDCDDNSSTSSGEGADQQQAPVPQQQAAENSRGEAAGARLHEEEDETDIGGQQMLSFTSMLLGGSPAAAQAAAAEQQQQQQQQLQQQQVAGGFAFDRGSASHKKRQAALKGAARVRAWLVEEDQGQGSRSSPEDGQVPGQEAVPMRASPSADAEAAVGHGSHQSAGIANDAVGQAHLTVSMPALDISNHGVPSLEGMARSGILQQLRGISQPQHSASPWGLDFSAFGLRPGGLSRAAADDHKPDRTVPQGAAAADAAATDMDWSAPSQAAVATTSHQAADVSMFTDASAAAAAAHVALISTSGGAAQGVCRLDAQAPVSRAFGSMERMNSSCSLGSATAAPGARNSANSVVLHSLLQGYRSEPGRVGHEYQQPLPDLFTPFSQQQQQRQQQQSQQHLHPNLLSCEPHDSIDGLLASLEMELTVGSGGPYLTPSPAHPQPPRGPAAIAAALQQASPGPAGSGGADSQPKRRFSSAPLPLQLQLPMKLKEAHPRHQQQSQPLWQLQPNSGTDTDGPGSGSGWGAGHSGGLQLASSSCSSLSGRGSGPLGGNHYSPQVAAALLQGRTANYDPSVMMNWATANPRAGQAPGSTAHELGWLHMSNRQLQLQQQQQALEQRHSAFQSNHQRAPL